VRLLAVLAAIAAAAAVAPAAVAATRPALSHLWHAYPLGHARLQTTRPATTTPPPATGAARATGRPSAGHGNDRRTDALLASLAAAVTVVAVVALGRRLGWVLRGPGPAQIMFFAAAAILGIVVGMLIPLIA
jgi:hypothetical protein